MRFKAIHLINYFFFAVIGITAGFLFFKNELIYNLSLYCIHLVLSFYFLQKISGKFYIQDVRVVFLLSYALYTIVLPLSVLLNSQTELFFYSYEDVGVNGTVILSTMGLCGFNFALLKYQVSWEKIETINYRKPIVNPFPAFLYLMTIMGGLIGFLFGRGVVLTISVENGRLATMSQTWVFLILLLNGAFIYFFCNYKRLQKYSKLFVILSFLFYAYLILIPLGGRRELVPVVCVLIFFLFQNYNSSFKNILYLSMVVVLFIAIGGIRELEKADVNVVNVFKYILVNNEFSIPPRHTIEYLRHTDWNLLFGWSYIYFPIMFMPRAFLGGLKPYSLAWQTDLKFNMSSGAAAYTPITEAYINFSWIGPIIIFFLLAILFSYSIKKFKTHQIIYILLYVKAFDFNRGEFALVLYEMAFMYLSYYITKILVNLPFAKVALQNS
jgi:oligosaccharide repeat unit polymerase